VATRNRSVTLCLVSGIRALDQLADEDHAVVAGVGPLLLDDIIERYIEGVPNGDEITLRQLANMTSWIADFGPNEQW
jgi:tRNA A22 N-methylase